MNKILRGHQKGDRKEENSRAEMTVTLHVTEHLLGKLSPGESQVIDGMQGKRKWKCGYNFCNSDPVFGNTGIGMLLSFT